VLGELTEKSVVVAEDDDDLSGEIAAIVRKAGGIPSQVRTGHGLFTKVAESLIHGSSERVSLVIADVYLPGISGLEAMVRLRRCGVATPLIVVTGQPSDEIDRVAAHVGANVVLPKPFGSSTLSRWIRALLGISPRI
jgi:DNA-binding response OmpR family regulator